MTEMTKELPKRDEIPKELTWDLESIFPTDDAWEEAFNSLKEQLPSIEKFQGILGESAEKIYDLFVLQDKRGEQLGKLYTYSHIRYDKDKTNSSYQQMNQRKEMILQ